MLSSHVDVLVGYLLEVAHPSERAFLAGDFKNFDGTLMSCLLWEIYEIIHLGSTIARVKLNWNIVTGKQIGRASCRERV